MPHADGCQTNVSEGAVLPRSQVGPDREVELLRTFVPERARLDSERLTAGGADQAALEETGPCGGTSYCCSSRTSPIRHPRHRHRRSLERPGR
jgi:hypothetical protein